jgi:ribosome biogenesis GTPase
MKLSHKNRIEEYITKLNISQEHIARVTTVHKDSYVVKNEKGIFRAEITGNLRFSAQTNADLPAVGDWVEIMPMDKQTVIIIKVLERFSKLSRQAVGKHGENQIIATNIDYAFIVSSLNQDFKINRIDRYIVNCKAGNITPIIILSKTDLISDHELNIIKKEIQLKYKDTLLLCLSIQDESSFKLLKTNMEANYTYCFIGSSGVGKSTIVNFLLGNDYIKTKEISTSNNKGRHTTTHREMFELENGSIVIDTPGMREMGVIGDKNEVESTFTNISELTNECKFSDCSHINEQGCAVLEALDIGSISQKEYENYQRLLREQKHFSQSVHEKRQKFKNFSKMIKEVKAKKKITKY